MTGDTKLGHTAARAGLWYTVGNVLLKGCVFLSLPIFTRLLTTTDFGIYNTYIAYEQILTALLGLGFYGTIKNAKLDFDQDFDKYLSSVAFFGLIMLCLTLILVNAFYPVLAGMLGFSRFIMNCLVLQAYGAYLLYFYGTKLNAEFKFRSYLSVAFLNGVGGIVCSILLIIFVFPNERYLGRIIGSGIPLILIGGAIIIILLRKGQSFFVPKYWRYALVMGVPLVPHVISQSLLSQFDRIMISSVVGSSDAGIYSYIYTLCTIMTIISSSCENAWAPWVYLMLRDGKEDTVRAASKNYIGLFTLMTIGFMCIMPEVTVLIAGSEYWGGIGLIIPLSVGNYFVYLYTFPVTIEYYHKKTFYISFGTIMAAGLNVLLNYLLIGEFGYYAAAYTTMISYMLLFLFHWLVARKFRGGIIYKQKNFCCGIAAVIIIGIILRIIQSSVMLSVIIRYIIIASILFVLYTKREVFVEILKNRDK